MSASSRHAWLFIETSGNGGSGLFPQVFALDRIRVVCSIAYQPEGPGSELILLGLSDGRIVAIRDEATNDLGLPIEAYAACSAVRPGGWVMDSMLLSFNVIGGENPPGHINSDWSYTITVQSGSDPWSAFDNPHQTMSKHFTSPLRQVNQGCRIADRDFCFIIRDSELDKIFSVDSLVGIWCPAGRTR